MAKIDYLSEDGRLYWDGGGWRRVSVPPGRPLTWFRTFDQCVEILTRPTFRSSPPRTVPDGLEQQGASLNLLFIDGRAHERMRRYLVSGLPPANVLRPLVEEHSDRLTHDLDLSADCDLVASFSAPIAVHMMARLLGLDPIGAPELIPLLEAATQFVYPPSMEPDASGEHRAAWLRSLLRFRSLVKDSHPVGDGALGHLRTLVEGGRITESEAAINALMLAHASFENSKNLLSLCALRLLRASASERAQIETSNDWVEDAIAAESPARVLARFSTERSSVGGVSVQPGALMLLSIADANDSAGSHRRHLAFGAGAHACLGASYARLELRTAMRSLARRIGNATFEMDSSWNQSMIFHGPRILRIRRLQQKTSAS